MARSRNILWLGITAAMVACAPGGAGSGSRPLDAGPADDTGVVLVTNPATPTRDAGTASGPDGGAVSDPSCVDAARLVYVLSADARIHRFDPERLAFEALSSLACPTSRRPFSMAMDRDGTAWVLFAGGGAELFRVSPTDGVCEPTSFAPGIDGFDNFGMGFASDATTGNDVLYVAGGQEADGIGHGSSLATLDLESFRFTRLRELSGTYAPELTGTGDGQLWGLFIQPDHRVTRLDAGASAADTFDIGTLNGGSSYAFAFWGGRFYLFLDDTVARLTPETGISENVLSDIGFEIVGAGVSTCAPTELI